MGVKFALLVLLLPLGVLLWWLRLRGEARYQIPANERNARTTLQLLATVEEDFRQFDRDGNGVKDYWTKDVAGLNYLGGPAGGSGRSASIQLISRDIAVADAAHFHDMPEGSKPYHGYYFKALELDDSGVPYAQNTKPEGFADKSLTKFAFCAFPAEYDRSGRWTYLINERKEIIRIDTQGKPIVRWGDPVYGPEAWTPMK
jgi:hypothetical protein